MDEGQLHEVVSRLRRQGRDDGQTEAKTAARSLPKDVWDSVSAFGNTQGGQIILGLSETDGFEPAANFDIDRVVDQLVDGLGKGGAPTPQVTPPPAFTLQRVGFEGHQLLVATIAPLAAGEGPCFVTAKGRERGSYQRIDDKNIRLSPQEIFELSNTFRPSRADRQPVPDSTFDDLDPDSTSSLLRRKAGSRALRGTTTEMDRLHRLNVVDANGQVTLGGLLVLGRFPQQHVPNLVIDVAVHPTRSKGEAPHQLRFQDRHTADGDLGEMVVSAVGAVVRNLRTLARVQGSSREEEVEIPPEVLREAIANAVLHRSYEDQFLGQPVTVDVYPDRVEIINPGGLWGGTTVDNIGDGISRCRNQALLQMLRETPTGDGLGPVVEGQGGGVPFMRTQMTAHSLREPEFTATPAQVKVTLRRHGLELVEYRRWLDQVSDHPLNEAEASVLVHLKVSGREDVAGLRRALVLDSDDVRHALEGLARKNLVHRDHHGVWHLGSQPPRTAGDEILTHLSTHEPRDIHQLTERTGRSPSALRKALRQLVNDGRVVATAPPQSRNRRYLLPD